MKQIFILIMCTILLATLVSGQIGSVEVSRELPDSVQPGQDVEVRLNIRITGEAPSGLILEEELPEGWEIVDDAGGVQRKGKFSFLLYGKDVQDKTITYTLRSPADLKEDTSIMGAWQVISTGGIIDGDMVLVVGEQADQNYIMIAAIVVGALIILGLIIYFLRKNKKK